MTRYRVSADIGGTFTDLVVEPSDAAVFVDKVPTTPDSPARGVVEAVRRRIPDTSDGRVHALHRSGVYDRRTGSKNSGY